MKGLDVVWGGVIFRPDKAKPMLQPNAIVCGLCIYRSDNRYVHLRSPVRVKNGGGTVSVAGAKEPWANQANFFRKHMQQCSYTEATQ